MGPSERASSLPLFLNGQFVKSQSTEEVFVNDPGTQECLCRVPLATSQEILSAIEGAKTAYLSWREVPVPKRARIMMEFCNQLKVNQEDIAVSICRENGKTFSDAMGEVWRGIEVVEQAANIPSLMMGETVGNVAANIDAYSYLQPIGVCVGVTPFNFPAMVPLWLFPMAIAAGNTFILKPSEQCPITAIKLADLFRQSGCPDGVLQVVHGSKDQVESLISHKDTKAVSFVGSESVARSIYQKSAISLKRVQAFGGAKNHMVILPDAQKENAIKNLVNAALGAAGQRCMAISVAVLVGEANSWIRDIKEAMERVSPGYWKEEGASFGPIISREAKERIVRLINIGVEEGATCLLNGETIQVDSYTDGNWLGPSLFVNVLPDMEIYKNEIFGPVLCVVSVDTIEDAIRLVNDNPFGNGTSLFTSSGKSARKFQHEIECGQVGINVSIPIPLPFFSFTGWKNSFYGDLHGYGKQAIRFYTETKTVTARWIDEEENKSHMTI